MRTFAKFCKKEEFSAVYRMGKKWSCDGIMIFYLKHDEQKMAVVASKKVGKAVVRNRSKRILRALFAKFENELQSGKYIFIAKSHITQISFSTLKKDLRRGFKKIECLK